MAEAKPKPDLFNALREKLLKLLPLDNVTRHVHDVIEGEYRERMNAIALSPFTPDERQALIAKAQGEYLERLEALCDQMPEF